jgi:hypothetical protein
MPPTRTGVALALLLAGWPVQAAVLRMFVTSTTCTGDLGSCTAAVGDSGLEAGDNLCQEMADGAGLNPGGTAVFRAWLSTSTTGAWCHIQGLAGTRGGGSPCDGAAQPGAGPWVRLDGLPWAADLAGLGAVESLLVLSPPSLDEQGVPIESPFLVWTGSNDQGLHQPFSPEPPVGGGGTCDGWTSATTDFRGTVGDTHAVRDDWSALNGTLCNAPARLLCLEAGVGDRVAVAETAAALAFVTSEGGTGDLLSWLDEDDPVLDEPMEAADEECRDLAAAAGLPFPGEFTAWLSDTSTDARDRFDQPFGWKRLDGMPVADDEADLVDGAITTSILVTDALEYTRLTAFTGSTIAGVDSSLNCVDWTSSSATGNTGKSGDSAYTDADWSSKPVGRNCSVPDTRLYCLGTREVLFWDGFELGDERRWSDVVP